MVKKKLGQFSKAWIIPIRTTPRDFSVLILFSFDLQFSIRNSKIFQNSKFHMFEAKKTKLNLKWKIAGCCFVRNDLRILKISLFCSSTQGYGLSTKTLFWSCLRDVVKWRRGVFFYSAHQPPWIPVHSASPKLGHVNGISGLITSPPLTTRITLLIPLSN